MAEYTRLADFDELIVRCRNDQAREHIAEAVASYRAGAFRACIVTTWIAVVYDIISKFRELASAGDAAAQTEISKLENIIKNHDIKGALAFEGGVLTLAQNTFSLLTQNEFNDLERLREDRQRCAHPSLNAVDQPYSPSAELARLHLRSAVQHLLMQEPVQGKAALARLFSDVKSEYFPSSTEKAREALSHGPLKRAKNTLVSNFTSALLSSLLKEDDLPVDAMMRRAAALNATRAMYRPLVEGVLSSKLSEQIRTLPDEYIHRVVIFVSLVPDVWFLLQPDVATKITKYIESIDVEKDILILAFALDCPELKSIAHQKIEKFDLDDLIKLIETYPRSELVPRAVNLYCDAGSFNAANHRSRKLIVPLVRYFSAAELEDLMEKAVKNGEVVHSFEFKPTLAVLKEANIVPPLDFDALMTKHGIT